MSRSRIHKQELVEILVVDRPWIPWVVGSQQAGSSSDGPELWESIQRKLADLQADRLLDPSWSGLLLDRPTVKQAIVEVGMVHGSFQIPGMPVRVTTSIASAMADIQLTMSQIDLIETHARRWERLEAILSAARMFGVEPTKFLLEQETAQDWILRISSDPETFRTHQRDRIDDKRPDVVNRYVQALRVALCDEARRQLGHTKVNIRIFVGFPMDEQYWVLRAAWLQAVEAQIERTWPGHGKGTNPAATDDA